MAAEIDEQSLAMGEVVVRDAADELRSIAAVVSRVVQMTMWRSDAAERFRESAARLEQGLRQAASAADQAADRLAADRLRLVEVGLAS